MTVVFAATHFLPIYFQAIKGVSPVMSSVNVLASSLSRLLGAVVLGCTGRWHDRPVYWHEPLADEFAVEKTGYIIPYTIFCGVVAAVSNGLYPMLFPTTSAGQWVGYQIFDSIGRGVGMQMVDALLL